MAASDHPIPNINKLEFLPKPNFFPEYYECDKKNVTEHKGRRTGTSSKNQLLKHRRNRNRSKPSSSST